MTEFNPSIKTEDDIFTDDEPLTEEDMIDGLDDEFSTCSEQACLLITQDGTEYDLTTIEGGFDGSFIERIDET